MEVNIDYPYEMYLGFDEAFYNWIWKKACHFNLNKASKNGKVSIDFPRLNPTEAIAEFLDRGFVYWKDYIPKPNTYYIETLICNLRYPVEYHQHMDTCKAAEEIGIPGYTKTVIPLTIKNK